MTSENKHYQALFKYFQERFPGQTEALFKLVARNRLEEIDEDGELESVSQVDAEKLENMFANLSEEHLVELAFSTSDVQLGKCYQEVFGKVT